MAVVLKNKVVTITGGASGIGYEIAQRYIERGAKITILLDINQDAGVKAVETLNKKYGENKAVFIKCDVTKDLEVIGQIIKEYKQVDVFVNNAGLAYESDVKQIVGINVTAAIEWGLKFWEHMRTDNGGQGGTILNLSSLFGFEPCEYLPVYSATKHAVFGFTKALGHETNFKKSGVRVIALCPGATHTNFAVTAWCYQEDMIEYALKGLEWQTVDAVGKAAVVIFENSASGTAWKVVGSRPVVQV